MTGSRSVSGANVPSENNEIMSTPRPGTYPGPTNQRRVTTSQKFAIPSSFFRHQKEAAQMAVRSSKVYHDLKLGKTVAGDMYRGGLVWHGTGSGKTVSGLGIIMQYLKMSDLLEKRGIPRPYICVVTTTSNERQNGMDKYLQNLMEYYPHYALELARAQNATITRFEKIRIFDALKKTFVKRVRFFNYVKFASCAGLYTKNNIQMDVECQEMRLDAGKDWARRGMVLILDESHELIKANMNDWKNDESTKNEYQAILRTKRLLEASTKNPFFHTFCMTATPGTKNRGIHGYHQSCPSRK